MPTADELRIATLEARVEALEAALEQRSEELRVLQRHLSRRDLTILARLEEGLPPLPLRAYAPDVWRETIELEAGSVEEVLADLWQSLHPAACAAAEAQKPA